MDKCSLETDPRHWKPYSMDKYSPETDLRLLKAIFQWICSLENDPRHLKQNFDG